MDINFLTFSLMKKKFLITAILAGLCASSIFAQISISGRVVTTSGHPVQGAVVRIEKTTFGCVTDKNGAFSLKEIPNGHYQLRASSTNYSPVVKEISSSSAEVIFILKESFINLDQVVVTGTGTHHKLKNSPVPIEVIGAKELKGSGATTFDKALTNLNPSFTFTSSAMSDKMYLNGLDGKYTLILVDGQKIAGDISGSVDLSRIDISRVKRIEILKGAASALYGSDAIAGVINIITDKSKSPMNISSSTRVGEYGDFSQSINGIVNVGSIYSSTSYRRLQSGGWQLNENEIVTAKNGDISLEPTKKQAVNGYFSNSFNQDFTFRAGKNLSIYARGGYYDKKGRRPYEEYNYDMHYQDFNIGAGAKYLTGGSSYVSFDIHSDIYEYFKVYHSNYQDFNSGDFDRQKRQNYLSTNLKGVFSPISNNKVTLGAEYIKDVLYSKSLANGKEMVSTGSLYIQDEASLGKFNVIAGGRFVYHQTFKGRFTPKISIMFSHLGWRFRSSYSSGFKAPSLLELYYDYESRGSKSIGNRDLNPEKSNYLSINSEYHNRYFTFNITGYLNFIDDMINRKLIPTSDEDKANGIKKTYLYDNISKAVVRGTDININSYIGYGVNFGASYSYTNAKDCDNNQRISGTSRHSATINGSWTREFGKYGYNLTFTGRLQSKRYYAGEEAADSHQLWNITFNQWWRGIGMFDIEPSIGIDNIFNYRDDKPYGSNYSTLSPGRTIFVSLLLNFGK